MGLVTGRRTRSTPPVEDGAGREGAGVVLVALLAVATPAGAALQSAIGTNVFSVRPLAASWPYLALSFAALLFAGRPALRYTASALALGAFAVAAVLMTGDDVTRPDFTALAEFADEFPGAVILDGQIFTPGPLTNLDVAGASPDGEIHRLYLPAQKERPFSLADAHTDPTEVGQQAIAIAEADGAPIVVIGFVPMPPQMQDLIDQLRPATSRGHQGGRGHGRRPGAGVRARG